MKKYLIWTLAVLLISGKMVAQSKRAMPASHKPVSKWAVLPGGLKLHYTEQGNPSGIPVILLHGFTDSWHSYEETMKFLPSSMRVIALTLRGHGDSDDPAEGYQMSQMAKDVASFCEKLGIAKAVIIGHSMGSLITQRFALDYPEKTEAVVLLSSFGNLTNNKAVRELADVIHELREDMLPAFAYEFQKSSLLKPIDSVYFDLLVKESIKVPLYVVKAIGNELMKVNYLDELKRLNKPVLIMCGDKDSVCPEADQQLLHGAIRGSQFKWYTETGHAIHWEQPQRVAKDIVDFIFSSTAKN